MDCFRILSSDQVTKKAVSLPENHEYHQPEPQNIITVAGAEKDITYTCARASTALVASVGGQKHQIQVGLSATDPQEGTAGELKAILLAADIQETNEPFYIETTNTRTINILTKSLPQLEDHNMTGIPHKDLVQKVTGKLRARKSKTFFKKAGHGQESNCGAKQAKSLAQNQLQSTDDHQPWDPPNLHKSLNTNGLKLSNIMQAVAYKAIKEQQMKKYSRCNRTKLNLHKAQAAVR